MAGVMVVTHSAAPQTNIVTDCYFTEIWRNAMRIYDNNAGNVWRISRCKFFRNYCNDSALCPGIYLGRQKDATQCHDFIASDCVFSECRLRRNSVGVLGYNGGYGGSGPYIFERCDFSGNIYSNTTASAATVCVTGILSTRYLFKDCSFRDNRVCYSGTGIAASVLIVGTSNSYINFLNCTFVGNSVSTVGEAPAKTFGTLVIDAYNKRLSVVNCAFDGNYVGGAATNAEIAASSSGWNSKLVVANSVLHNDAPGYAPVRGPKGGTGSLEYFMFLYHNYMSNFDQEAVGPVKFIRCAENVSGYDPVLSERLRTACDRPSYCLGIASHRSPLWRGALNVQFWQSNVEPYVKVVAYDKDKNGASKPWTQLYVNNGFEGNMTDAEAAAYGIAVGNDGVPDALGNPRPWGKVAYGPLNLTAPTVVGVR